MKELKFKKTKYIFMPIYGVDGEIELIKMNYPKGRLPLMSVGCFVHMIFANSESEAYKILGATKPKEE